MYFKMITQITRLCSAYLILNYLIVNIGPVDRLWVTVHFFKKTEEVFHRIYRPLIFI